MEEKMNGTIEKLEAAYRVRFIGTAVCVVCSVVSTRLILLGKISDNLVPALGIALIGGYIGWKGTVNLMGRWKQLQQLNVLHERGPYGTREYVHPGDAARQVGDNDRNMWG
jgi:hypothetical protein